MAGRGRASAFATKADLEPLATKVELTELRGEIRGLGVAIEQVNSNVAALAEGLLAQRHELKSDIAGLEARLSARITVLEEVVRQNSREIQKNSDDIRRLGVEVTALGVEVAELRVRFDRRDVRLEELEKRVADVEKRVATAK